MIAGDEHLATAGIPNGERKHTIESFDACLTPLLVGMYDHFRIGQCLELVPGLFEFLTQLDEIVDFAIEYNLQAAVLVADWLSTTGHVNDAQPAMSQPDLTIHP